MKKILLSIVVSLLLVSCAAKEDKDIRLTSDWSVEQLYTEAKNELNDNNYNRAIKLYGILQSRFPYGKFSEQATLDIAYAYYKDEENEKAINIIEQFQKLYPKHPQIDYVLYLKALSQFNEYKSIFNKIAAQNWAERDPEANKKAYATFAELIERFPDSKYVSDARDRMEKLVEAMGGHEIAIARHYFESGAYLASANRAQNVITNFQNTSFVEEALAILWSSYDHLGQEKLAVDAKRVLELNFSNSNFLQRGGWFNQYNLPWYSFGKSSLFQDDPKKEAPIFDLGDTEE